MEIARHAGRVEVGPAVTCGTDHAGGTVTILAAHDQRLMETPQVGLARPLTGGMAIHAARMLQNLTERRHWERAGPQRLAVKKHRAGTAAHRSRLKNRR